MPPYEWLIDQQLDTTTTISKINAMRTLGVPYALGYEQLANSDLQKQAKAITEDLKQGNVRVQSDREIIAIIAYIQRLGKDIRTK